MLKLFVIIFLCHYTHQYKIDLNCERSQILFQALNRIISQNTFKDLLIIYDHSSINVIDAALQEIKDNSYIVRDCNNREAVLIENKLIILIINSINNNYHVDCIKYLILNQVKVIVLDVEVLSSKIFGKILNYLRYKQQFDVIGIYETNNTFFMLNYDYILKQISKNKIINDLMVERPIKDVQGKTLNLLIASRSNELLIGNEVLKYEDDSLLEMAILSINATMNYLKWDEIETFNDMKDLNERNLKIYNIFALITNKDAFEVRKLFKETYPFEMEYLTLVVPKSKPLTLEENLMKIHSQGIWMLFVFYSKIYGILWVLIRIITKQSWKSIYCYDFNILFDPFYDRLKKTSCEYLLMLSAAWFTFFAFSTFQVQLITTMTSLKFMPQIQTLQEVCKSQDVKKILTFNHIVKNVLDTYEPSCNNLPLMLQSIQKQDTSLFINELFLNLINDNETAYLLDQKYAKLVATSRFNRMDGIPLYYVTRDRLLPRFKSYYIRKTSRYYNVINKRMNHLYESGFQIYWSEQIRHKYRLKGLLYPDDYVDSGVLTKANVLKMLLYMLTLDIIAFIYIVVEIYCKKLELWLERKNINLFFWTKWTNTNGI